MRNVKIIVTKTDLSPVIHAAEPATKESEIIEIGETRLIKQFFDKKEDCKNRGWDHEENITLTLITEEQS